jgi:phosphate acyltransferase
MGKSGTGGQVASPNGATGAPAGSPVIAVDAMGGDHAPLEILKGAIEAQRRGAPVVLVGRTQVIAPLLAELNGKLPIVEAEEVIGMDAPVGRALRLECSSLRVAANLVSAGEAHAVVSAGNSAAIMGIAYQVWKPLPGIDRPAFGAFLPARNGPVFVLDIGANTTVKPSHLVQFAVMGSVYVQITQGTENPRLALLSNGTEDSKGTKEVKHANETLRKLDLNFVGNVEGNQVFESVADVIVCDGFSGNILLKGAEGVATEIFDMIRAELSKDLISKVAAAALMPSFARIRRRVDYEEYGGVPVLGVNEIMINCHGRSRAKAVTNAILLAQRLAQQRLPQRIREAFQSEEAAEASRRRRLVRALHLSHE